MAGLEHWNVTRICTGTLLSMFASRDIPCLCANAESVLLIIEQYSGFYEPVGQNLVFYHDSISGLVKEVAKYSSKKYTIVIKHLAGSYSAVVWAAQTLVRAAVSISNSCEDLSIPHTKTTRSLGLSGLLVGLLRAGEGLGGVSMENDVGELPSRQWLKRTAQERQSCTDLFALIRKQLTVPARFRKAEYVPELVGIVRVKK